MKEWGDRAYRPFVSLHKQPHHHGYLSFVIEGKHRLQHCEHTKAQRHEDNQQNFNLVKTRTNIWRAT
jgi:hypothetical protein